MRERDSKQMKPFTKIYMSAAAALLFAVTITWLWSNHRIARLEREVSNTKAVADEKQRLASQRETEAAEYKQKIEYLETEIAGIGRLARKQDEELKKIGGDIGDARRVVERAKRIRSVSTNTAELCGKLEELGYPCGTRRQAATR